MHTPYLDEAVATHKLAQAIAAHLVSTSNNVDEQAIAEYVVDVIVPDLCARTLQQAKHK